MDELKKLLMTHDNLPLVIDIANAKTEIIVELLHNLIKAIHDGFVTKGKCDTEFAPNVEPMISLEEVRDRYTAGKNNYFGVFVKLPNSAVRVGSEIWDTFYYGATINKEANKADYDFVRNATINMNSGAIEQWWPYWNYVDNDFHAYSLSGSDLQNLADEAFVYRLAEKASDRVYALWKTLNMARTVATDD